jgi:uncharacterized membrane protein YjgN (DUF898 family)
MNMSIFLVIVILGVILIVKSKDWSVKLQQYYISQAKRYGNSEVWARPWITVLFRVMIIFVGLVLIIAAYPLAFGPVYIQR